MEKRQLPLFGVGPIYVLCSAIVVAIVLFLKSRGVFSMGEVQRFKIGFEIIGGIMIIGGILMWGCAILAQKVMREIKKGNLVTTGVYKIVRNPIYSAFLFIFTGILLAAHNWYLLLFPVLFYIVLTVLMKNTEEKWLLEKFGDSYQEYMQHVNRIIPWLPH